MFAFACSRPAAPPPQHLPAAFPAHTQELWGDLKPVVSLETWIVRPALYEAMVRIEQCVWCRRSEGDLRNGVGKQCWDLGNLGEAATFAQNYGIADPDCFPYTEAAAIYSAEEGHGATPLATTPDRAGRTVRVPTAVTISDVTQKKLWIDTVGPMAIMFNPPTDFDAYGGGVYIPTTTARPALPAGIRARKRSWGNSTPIWRSCSDLTPMDTEAEWSRSRAPSRSGANR